MPKAVDYLSSARKASNITQAQIGKRLGVSKQTISAWETYYRKLPLDKAIEWAQLLDVPLDQLLKPDRKEHSNESERLQNRNIT